MRWRRLSGGRFRSPPPPAPPRYREYRERHLDYLGAIGITVWIERDALLPTALDDARDKAGAATGLAKARPAGDPGGLESLRDLVAGCRRCPLHETRTQTVFGVGDASARCMIIGEAPGADEDARGEPFVGRAGRLLNAMMGAIGLPRDAVYIANIVKCRPPRNRDPRPEEVASCAGYLRRQIDLIGPRVILAVGRVAAQNLLDTTQPLGRMRGRDYTYADTGIPVVVTYHPAYLLRSPTRRANPGRI